MEHYNEADIRMTLFDAQGNLSWAAARCGLTRSELCRYIDATPSLQAALEDIRKRFDDEVETACKAGGGRQAVGHRLVEETGDGWRVKSGRTRTQAGGMPDAVDQVKDRHR